QHCKLPWGDINIRTYNLCIVGLGNVGSALVALLQRKRQDLAERYGIQWRITGIASRHLGWLVAPDGFDTEKLLAGDNSEATKATDISDWLRTGRVDALFEASSLNAETGEPAITHIRCALELGSHAISANKGPVLHAYRELTQLAESKGR